MNSVPAAHLPDGRRDRQKNLGQKDVLCHPNTLADGKTGTGTLIDTNELFCLSRRQPLQRLVQISVD